MLTLEGFPFITVNTKEYHSECSGKITRIMRRTLVNSLLSERVKDFDTLGFPALKYSSYIGMGSNSNSYCDLAVLSAGETTLGTSFELDGSLLWS
ncbi:hypothetical protein Tco_1123516 [Tanacetum coccineum]|uniref:Uncharacterized protein n=1 Tax=Tanacetum coccineum TaxID=301880 RepID=A0ABQ5J4N2_9ASTR